MNEMYIVIISLAFIAFITTFISVLPILLNKSIENIKIQIRSQYKEYNFDDRIYKLKLLPLRILIRTFDIMISLILFIILSPFLLIIAIAIKLYDAGPVFFAKEIIGYKGKKITIIEFRTGFLADKKTLVGMILVACGLDKIPTLINLFRGDLSLWGLSFYPIKYINEINLFKCEKPGMFNLWSHIQDNVDDTFIQNQIQCDKYYLNNKSVKLNFYIFLMNLSSIFTTKDKN